MLLNHPIKLSQSAKDFFINEHKYNNIPIQYTHQDCILKLKKHLSKLQTEKKPFQLLKKHCLWSSEDWEKWGSETE